jgi:hypothetical protein
VTVTEDSQLTVSLLNARACSHHYQMEVFSGPVQMLFPGCCYPWDSTEEVHVTGRRVHSALHFSMQTRFFTAR